MGSPVNLLEPIGLIDERLGQAAQHSSDDPVAPYDLSAKSGAGRRRRSFQHEICHDTLKCVDVFQRVFCELGSAPGRGTFGALCIIGLFRQT